MSSTAAVKSRVLVIGAGIGGLTTALALRDAGIEAEVCEAAPALAAIQVGYGIHLWSNAMKALRSLGIADAVKERSERFERMHFETVGGRTLIDWPLGEAEEVLGDPIVGIVRSELHAVLADRVGEDAMRFGAALQLYEQDGDGVTARFADGSEARADVLIGADGIRSTVRQQLLGDGPPPYRGIAERHALISVPDGTVPPGTFHEHWSKRDRFGFYPVKGAICWYLLGPDRQGTQDPRGAREAVLEKLDGWPPLTRELVEATPAEDVVRLEIYVQHTTDTWVSGRVGLLGDAAHAIEPSGGQGSAQAIEDAVVLARCLAAGGSPADALVEYQRLRIPRVKVMRQTSTIVGRIGRLYRPFVPVRNLIYPYATPALWRKHKRGLVFEP
jgi:2-polyprenyl-6-methoxyphenol hydroxylase-like FAD-dependent oxidoreductase